MGHKFLPLVGTLLAVLLEHFIFNSVMMKFNAWYSLEGFKQSESLQDSDARFQPILNIK